MATENMVGSRKERRAAYAIERKKFVSGQWGAWKQTDLPDGLPGGRGWCREVRRAYSNGLYAVLVRHVKTSMGIVAHCAIRTASQLEPPWRDKQRIKNELFSSGCTAIEVMPPDSEVVDGADMYHIWVLQDPLPFGLHTQEKDT